MHYPKSSLQALVLFAFLSVPGLARFGLQRRLVCTQDDLYSMFHSAPPEDIDYWCSSYIGLTDVQSSSNAYTVRTTTVTTTTTYTPYSHTTTTPDYIATVTTTEGQVRKRVAAPSPTPAVELATLYSAVPVLVECDETAANKSLISSVSSGCSCLFIMPRTIPFLATTTTTRTETAVDYEASDIYTTETGYSTRTVTVLPTPIGNYTFPGSTGALSTTYTVSIPYISGSPAPSSNVSIPSASSMSALPSSAPSNPTLPSFSVCPARDGQIITESDGEQFQILCYTNFTGQTVVGLDEPNYGACVQQCALDNDGFSAPQCYGISYFPNQIGPNCYLKTKPDVAMLDYNPAYQIVSARLLINATNTTSSSITISAAPTGPTNTSSISIPDPNFPNITNSGDRNGPNGEPTSSPTTSLPQNITTTPGPTAPSSMNTTDLWPYPTNTTDLWPYPTNTTDLWPYPTNTTDLSPYPTNTTDMSPYPTNTTLPTNPSASITASNSLNLTTYPSITPTPSDNLTSTPSGFPITFANYTTPTDNATLTGDSRGMHSYPTTNASICISTQWITGYTSACVSTTTIIVTSRPDQVSGSATTTVTEIYTLTS